MIFKFPYFAHNLRKQAVITLHDQTVPSGCVPKLTHSTGKAAYSKSNIHPLVILGSSICTMQQIHLRYNNTTISITSECRSKNKEAERKHYRYYYQKSLFAGKHRKTD